MNRKTNNKPQFNNSDKKGGPSAFPAVSRALSTRNLLVYIYEWYITEGVIYAHSQETRTKMNGTRDEGGGELRSFGGLSAA